MINISLSTNTLYDIHTLQRFDVDKILYTDDQLKYATDNSSLIPILKLEQRYNRQLYTTTASGIVDTNKNQGSTTTGGVVTPVQRHLVNSQTLNIDTEYLFLFGYNTYTAFDPSGYITQATNDIISSLDPQDKQTFFDEYEMYYRAAPDINDAKQITMDLVDTIRPVFHTWMLRIELLLKQMITSTPPDYTGNILIVRTRRCYNITEDLKSIQDINEQRAKLILRLTENYLNTLIQRYQQRGYTINKQDLFYLFYQTAGQ